MSKEQQNMPMLAMWERILRIRRQLYAGEESSAIPANGDTQPAGTVSLERIQEELTSKEAMDEIPGVSFNEWVTEDSFNDFEDFVNWNNKS
jgi:hypothetical protein